MYYCFVVPMLGKYAVRIYNNATKQATYANKTFDTFAGANDFKNRLTKVL